MYRFEVEVFRPEVALIQSSYDSFESARDAVKFIHPDAELDEHWQQSSGRIRPEDDGAKDGWIIYVWPSSNEEADEFGPVARITQWVHPDRYNG